MTAPGAGGELDPRFGPAAALPGELDSLNLATNTVRQLQDSGLMPQGDGPREGAVYALFALLETSPAQLADMSHAAEVFNRLGTIASGGADGQ